MKGGAVKVALSDHGPQYYSNNGKSRFTLYLEAHGIEHITGSIGKPTTQGKIERFFQTFQLYYPKFNDLNQFREYYNNKPHRSLKREISIREISIGRGHISSGSAEAYSEGTDDGRIEVENQERRKPSSIRFYWDFFQDSVHQK